MEEPEEEHNCYSCNSYFLEHEMAGQNICLDCQEDQDNDYENSFRNAFD